MADDIFRAFAPFKGGDARWVTTDPAGDIAREGFFGAPAPGGGASPVVYRDHQWSTGTNFTTCTWAAMAIGTAASDRWVIAALNINHNTSRAISTVSIGGVSATKLYAAPSPRSDDGVSFEFWAANVPTGTTADVVATAASGQFWDGAAWTYTCAGEPIFHDGEVDQSLTSNTFSVSIDVAEGGAVIALVNGDEPASLSAWAGATSDFTDEGRELYTASADELTAETGRTVSWTGTAAPSPAATFYGLGVVSIKFGSGASSLTPALYSDADTFGAATITQGGGAQTLTAALFADGDTFGAATVAAGAVTLTPTAYSDGDTFGAALIAVGAVTLTPARYNDADTFGAAAVTTGAVTLTPALYADGDTFGAASISQGGATQELTPARVVDGDSFGAASITVGSVTLTAARVNDGDTFGAASITVGAVTLTTSLYADPDTFGAATVIPSGGTQSLSPAIYADPDTFGAHTVSGGTTRQPGGFAPVIYLDRNNRPVGLSEVKKQALEAVPEAVEPKVEAAIERIEDLAGDTTAFAAVAAQYQLLARLVQAFDDALAMELQARALEAMRRAQDEDDVELLLMAI